MRERTNQKFLATLYFTFEAKYFGDKDRLLKKLKKKITDNPELIADFIGEENGFELELTLLHE